MGKRAAALAVMLIALLAVAGCSTDAPVEPDNTGEKVDAESFETIYSGSVAEGDVAVELTPKGVIDGKLMVDIGANTHSVNLEQFDLTKITTLEYNGKILMPESAPTLGGHHASGTLVFDAGEPVGSFRIVIRGIPKVDERIFEWN